MNGDDLLTDLAAELAGVQARDARTTRLAALLDTIATRPGEHPEDVLLDLRLVDDRQLALALAMRSGRRYQGLRGVRVDERLFLYLPYLVARRERVVPLVLVGDTLLVAAAYPDPDLSYLRENFPRLDLELAISPRDEILDALDRVRA